jgi:outer membrane protein
MKHTSKLLVSTVLSCFALPFLSANATAQSTDLLSLYQKAENYDAGIFAAESAYLAELEGEKIAFSGLLPSINARASYGHTNSNGAGQNDDSYQTTSYGLALSQPLLNLPTWHAVSASEQNTLRAKVVYHAAQQNLILNVASAYFGVLRGQENLRSDRSQEAAVKRQYEQAKEQFDVGLIAITDVHEAKASYDASQTARIRSEGNLTIALENLARITGEFADDLHGLKDNYPISLDESTTEEQWLSSAQANNLNIKIADYALKSIENSLKSARAAHLPTLNLEANYGDAILSNYYQAGSDNNESSDISLVLNVPLYSGGATQASVRQSRHQLAQAQHQLTSAQRQAKIETRTELINLKTNIQTVESLKQNIVSRESALEATREGYKVGTRNIVEVLDAERSYFTALRDYANARFDFVESSLRIKQATGTLNVIDIEALNKWLAPSE